MRLAEFIHANTEQIINEWEGFARTLFPAVQNVSELVLHDHVRELLEAVSADLQGPQSTTEQTAKSKGQSPPDLGNLPSLDSVGGEHARVRAEHGFTLTQLVAEYRALRASVVRLWDEAMFEPNQNDRADLTRFNESIDQALTASIVRFTTELDRSKELFLGMLGHELRDPLSAILITAEVLARSRDGPTAKGAARIALSARRMSQLVGDLLEFTRARLGTGISLVPAAVDLASLCKDVLDEMATLHPNYAVRFESSGDLGGKWDGARLRQVASNLVRNAVQHGAAGTDVVVRAQGEGSEVELTVHNEGAPIPQGLLQTIFDPFVRAPSGASMTSGQSTSVGLGLYIAREIVTAHGGTLDVASSHAEGTTFTARLPRRSNPAADPARAA